MAHNNQNMPKKSWPESPSCLKRESSSIDDGDPEMIVQMADQSLAGGPGRSSRIPDYLDIKDMLYPVSPKEKRRTLETEMSVQPENRVPPNSDPPSENIEDEVNIFSNAFEPLPQRRADGRSARNTQNGLCRDYQKNITKVVTHMSCREFGRDNLAKEGAKIRCIQLEVPYDAFETLLRQIEKDNHISNKRLLTCYLQPRETDPQIREKLVFAEYFDYFLRNCLNVAVRRSPSIQNKSAYISYCREYLVYLGTKCVNPRTYVQNRRT